MPAMTIQEILGRIDGPVEPRPEFADRLRGALLDELAPAAEPAPMQEVWRVRPPRRPAPRRWMRVAIAAAAALLLAVAVVIVQLPSGRGDALAVMREARAAFADLPPFRATVVQRTSGRSLEEVLPASQRPAPDLVLEREIAYLDETHFRNEITGSTWDDASLETGSMEIMHAGELWVADGTFFGHVMQPADSLMVGPVEDETSLAFFAAGQLDPDVDQMPEPGDRYFTEHCELLPDEILLGRTVRHLHCTDPDSRAYADGPTLDVDTYVDAETGMLLKMESRNEGMWFEVRDLDLSPTFDPDEFDVTIPPGSAVVWTGGGTPPPEFRQQAGPSVTTFPIGNNPERVAVGAGGVWVSYTEGGTGDLAEGGHAAVARLDPVTGGVVARIDLPVGIDEMPRNWVGALTHTRDLLATDDAVFVSYKDAGDATPVTVARIDPATNTLGAPLATFDSSDGMAGGGLGFLDGSLWAVHGDGGEGSRDLPNSSLIRLDPTTGEVLGEFGLPGAVQGSVEEYEGTLWLWAWVPAERGSDISVELLGIDPATGEVIDSITLPDAAGAAAFGEGSLWVRRSGGLRAGTVRRMDPATGADLAQIRVGPDDGAIQVAEGRVWVTNALDNTLMAIDPATNEVVSTTRVGAYPLWFDVGDGVVWVANLRDASVSHVDVRVAYQPA